MGAEIEKRPNTMPDRIFKKIAEKVSGGVRLSLEDGIALMESNDLVPIGKLANAAKEKVSGNYAYFNINRHINLTNVCISRCKFCAFSRDRNDPGAYTMSAGEAVRAALSDRDTGITELHVVSGLHPDLPFDYYLQVIASLRQALPGVHIKAFTAVEINYFSKIADIPIHEVILQLQKAGVGSLPGGGAEILHPRVREFVCPNKASAGEWLEVMRTAHGLGLKSNATMLYGHVETIRERVEHLVALRELQDETGGFQAFIPLPFHPGNTQLTHVRKPSAFENLKVLAVSRLFLDNFPHIKAYWIMLGLKTAQLSLLFGADDLDGTVGEEKITHSAGAMTGQSVSRGELCELIRATGRAPVERDTLYKVRDNFDRSRTGAVIET